MPGGSTGYQCAGDGTKADSAYDSCTEAVSAELFARVRLPQPQSAITVVLVLQWRRHGLGAITFVCCATVSEMTSFTLQATASAIASGSCKAASAGIIALTEISSEIHVHSTCRD